MACSDQSSLMSDSSGSVEACREWPLPTQSNRLGMDVGMRPIALCFGSA